MERNTSHTFLKNSVIVGDLKLLAKLSSSIRWFSHSAKTLYVLTEQPNQAHQPLAPDAGADSQKSEGLVRLWSSSLGYRIPKGKQLILLNREEGVLTSTTFGWNSCVKSSKAKLRSCLIFGADPTHKDSRNAILLYYKKYQIQYPAVNNLLIIFPAEIFI